MASLGHDSLMPERGGRRNGSSGLVVRECTGLALASVIARRGATARASETALAAFGVALPSTPCVALGRGISFVWTGPGNWLAEADNAPGGIEELLRVFDGIAAVCEQTDSRVIVEIHGPRVRDVLAKGLPIDLHPSVFRVGDVAVTAVHHVGVHVRQVAASPVYRLSVVRSYFGSFWHWLRTSAAEFGYEVLTQAGPPED